MLLTSEVVHAEIDRITDIERKERVLSLSKIATGTISAEENEIQRGNQLEQMGFHFVDALHIACAESGRADVFLTTDDRLLRLALRVSQNLKVRVANPVNWLTEVIKT